MLLRYGLLGVLCSLLFWIALIALVIKFLWPVLLVLLAALVVWVIYRRRKRRKH